ncbi:MAG: S8 family serine peptidase [Gammaproteobacteria bacterium]|jgi:serine protease AprX|nr:S8 family serine peptidase [Gammaproteobacteria bacterium]
MHTKLIIKSGLWSVVTTLIAATALAGVAQARPNIGPGLELRLAHALADQHLADQELGVLLTFAGETVTETAIADLESLGITMGVVMHSLPIVGINGTAAQIEQLAEWDSLRSIYLNHKIDLNLHQTRPLIQVDRLRASPSLIQANAGLPVTGKGITIAINDSGIDGSHDDLSFNPLQPASGKTIQNVQLPPSGDDGLLVRTDATGRPTQGILPVIFVEDAINTDSHIGHGTHVAGIAAGTGAASGGLYAGVAPGASLIGLGSGFGLFVLGQVAAFDYVLTHQFQYNIRVVNNSWGNSAMPPAPDHPINVASKALHDRGIAVVFANGNDGPRPNSQNRWASLPHLITAGAATKDGRLAGFSSRGILLDSEIHPTVLTPGTGGPGPELTSAVIAPRARTNTASNGLTSDAQIPLAFIANYTQISGTSMASPHLAGIIANVLEADPTLAPEQVKNVLERTATALAPYDQFEVGAGLANVHAAVDLAFHPDKPYGALGFAGKGLALTRAPIWTDAGVLPPGGSQTHPITVPVNSRFTMVQVDWQGSAGEDQVIIDNTNVVLHDLRLEVLHDGQVVASSDALQLAGLFGAREAVKLEFPQSGEYLLRVSSGFIDTLTEQPYTVQVEHFTFDPGEIADLAAVDEPLRDDVLRLVYDRVLHTDSQGNLRPEDDLTRADLARALMLAGRVPQFYPDEPGFSDLAPGSDLALIAESLRKSGILATDSGTVFGADTTVVRLDLAVGLIRGLRLEQAARDLAGSTVTYEGQALLDNAAIPEPFRGHVQLALDFGLMEVTEAQVVRNPDGSFTAIPGPKFHPERIVRRDRVVAPMQALLLAMFGE